MSGDTLAARFWSKVEKTEDCWIWTGCRNADGYGRFNWEPAVAGNSTIVNAHRGAWQLAHGSPPEPGMVLDHLCRNRACVNPSHLEPVTSGENHRRGLRNQNTAKTQCKHGHPLDAANTRIDIRGNRECRQCRRLTVARHRARQKARG